MKKLLILCVLIGLVAYFVTAGVPFTGESESRYDLTIVITDGGHVTHPGEVLEVGKSETFRFDSGSVVDLRAVAATGYSFLNWTGDVGTVADVTADQTTIVMDADCSITANFVNAASTCILTIDSTDGGSVTVPGENAFPCDPETEVPLTAEADEGYAFVAWTGDVDEVEDVNAATTTITMEEDYYITANFGVTHTLSVSSSEGGSVTVPGEDEDGYIYGEGAIVPLVAAADEGAVECVFINWTGDVDTIGGAVELEEVGAGNGSQTEWTLANNPILEDSVTVYVNGTAQTEDTDYAIAYDTGEITFTTAPQLEASIRADYYYLDATSQEASIMINADYEITANFVKWAVRYDGDYSYTDQATAMALDDQGNIYVTGRSYDGDDPLDPSDPVTGYDYLTIKYDSELNEVWTKSYNGSGDGADNVVGIVVANGRVYITGTSLGSTTNCDYATVAYDTNGNELWAARYDGSSDWDEAKAIAVDAGGNVYVTGYCLVDGNYDCVTVKYDSNGTEQWDATYDGGDRDMGSAIAVDGNGNVYVTGYSHDASTQKDYATVKYDSDGNEQWAAIYDGPASGDDSAKAIALDGAGNIIVTGTSTGSGEDYATVKYDNNGNELWVARYDGSGGTDTPSALALDGNGNVYVTGQSNEGSNDDYATIKYNSSGTEQWVARYDGEAAGNDAARGMAVDGEGNVYVTGASEVTSGEFSYATIAYDSDGNELWDSPVYYSGPVSQDYANAIVVDADGNIFVTGSSEDTYTDDDYVTHRIIQ